MKQTNRLAMILGFGGLTGAVPLAAAAGLFKLENAFSIAVLFMAGPGAILTAVLMGGEVKQRMLAALLAGIIATIIVVLAAGIGPALLDFVNLNIMKIAGGIAIIAIALLIMGVKIPEHLPTIIMVVGLILSVIIK
jgi:hypothetical protein